MTQPGLTGQKLHGTLVEQSLLIRREKVVEGLAELGILKSEVEAIGVLRQ